MGANEFLEKMVDILDCEEELNMDTVLAEMGPNAKAPIKADDVKKAETIADLFALLG